MARQARRGHHRKESLVAQRDTQRVAVTVLEILAPYHERILYWRRTAAVVAQIVGCQDARSTSGLNGRWETAGCEEAHFHRKSSHVRRVQAWQCQALPRRAQNWAGLENRPFTAPSARLKSALV